VLFPIGFYSILCVIVVKHVVSLEGIEECVDSTL
jgi:hypothetical protein